MPSMSFEPVRQLYLANNGLGEALPKWEAKDELVTSRVRRASMTEAVLASGRFSILAPPHVRPRIHAPEALGRYSHAGVFTPTGGFARPHVERSKTFEVGLVSLRYSGRSRSAAGRSPSPSTSARNCASSRRPSAGSVRAAVTQAAPPLWRERPA
jgi:hypothetical protein